MTFKICAVGLIGALLAYFLGEMGFKNKKLLSVLSIVILFGAAKTGVASLIEKAVDISNAAGISDACSCALKAVGLGYLFGFVADTCCELGESSIAKAVTVVGNVEIVLVSLPYFEKTLNLGMELLK